MAQVKLDAELVFDRFLGNEDVLEALQAVLVSKAPKWATDLYIRKSQKVRVPVDFQDPRGLHKAVLEACGERGPTYDALVLQYGRGDERLCGSAELRGSKSGLVVVVSVDQKPFARTGGCLLLRNDIAIQARQRKIVGVEVSLWLRDVFIDLCRRTAPAWGSVYDDGEYWAKVMTETPSVEAVGRDFSKFLPGLFWVNFFGKPYTELIGRNRIADTPAASVQDLDVGIVVQAYEDPLKWSELPARDSVTKALHHLGEEYFFHKENPDQRTCAPDWGAS